MDSFVFPLSSLGSSEADAGSPHRATAPLALKPDASSQDQFAFFTNHYKVIFWICFGVVCQWDTLVCSRKVSALTWQQQRQSSSDSLVNRDAHIPLLLFLGDRPRCLSELQPSHPKQLHPHSRSPLYLYTTSIRNRSTPAPCACPMIGPSVPLPTGKAGSGRLGAI